MVLDYKNNRFKKKSVSVCPKPVLSNCEFKYFQNQYLHGNDVNRFNGLKYLKYFSNKIQTEDVLECDNTFKLYTSMEFISDILYYSTVAVM